MPVPQASLTKASLLKASPRAAAAQTGRPPASLGATSVKAAMGWERPLAGEVTRRRAREAAVERGTLAVLLFLALTVGGFAGYTLARPVRPYDVRAVMPARSGPFAWKRSVAEARLPEMDLDPLVTGSLPEPSPSPPPSRAEAAPALAPSPVPPTGYRLRRAAQGFAVIEDATGLHEVGVGAVLPGLGRILSIRNTGAGWIVITTETIIGPVSL
jgi:hypothetical protein